MGSLVFCLIVGWSSGELESLTSDAELGKKESEGGYWNKYSSITHGESNRFNAMRYDICSNRKSVATCENDVRIGGIN